MVLLANLHNKRTRDRREQTSRPGFDKLCLPRPNNRKGPAAMSYTHLTEHERDCIFSARHWSISLIPSLSFRNVPSWSWRKVTSHIPDHLTISPARTRPLTVNGFQTLKSTGAGVRSIYVRSPRPDGRHRYQRRERQRGQERQRGHKPLKRLAAILLPPGEVVGRTTLSLYILRGNGSQAGSLWPRGSGLPACWPGPVATTARV